LTVVDGMAVATERVRPFYHLVLRAHMACLDSGKVPSPVNLAKELRRSRQAVHLMFLRHPDLGAWIDRHVSAANEHYVGSVIRRVAMLAMQGSPQHAELFFKQRVGAFDRRGFGDEALPPGAELNVNNYTLNLLVPRPEVPAPTPRPALPDITLEKTA
jgi:hypothetical protein